jgi:hypothetical protein
MSKEITPPEENIITGDVSRIRTMPGINFAAEVVNKEEDKDKISVPTGRVVTEEQKDTTPEDMFTSTMEKIKTETETSGSTEGDAFLNLVDQGEISLNNLDFQYSSKDMDLMGKFDRLKLLRELRKDNRITGSRYISLKSQIPISAEEAAILESRELNRPVDPDEILKDPLLMNKYGLMELDAQLAESIQELQEAGVDVTAGAPANIRAEVGRFSNEESKLLALEQLQEDGQILFYKPSKLGMIITVPSADGPKDLLLDEIGFSGKDFLDMTSEIPGIAANIAATAGAVVMAPGLIAGGTIGLAGLAAISGISYFAGSASSDLINRAFSKNQIYAIDQIAKERGVEAAMAAGLDFLLIGGFKLGKGIINKFIGPVAGSGDLAVKNYLKSIAQGKQVIQYDSQGKIIFNKDGSPKLGDIQLTPGLVTQSQTIQRIEGVTEKIPGSADILQVQKDIIEKQLIELEQRARGNVPVVETVTVAAGKNIKQVIYKGDDLTSAEVGENVSSYVSRELKTKEDAIAFERGVVIKEADQALDNVASSLSTSGNIVKTKDAGELVIDTLKTSKKNYLDEFDRLTKEMTEIDGYNGNITIDASGINKAAKKLEESFPTKEIERTVNQSLGPGLGTAPTTIVESTPILPKQLSGSILDDLKNVSDMTVDQAIKFKKILKESYSGETLPTDADKLITQIINNIDFKIQGAIRSQGPDVLQAYNAILNHEASKGGIFTNALIKKILDDGVEPENIFVKQILQGNEAEIRILTNALGKDNPILGDVKSAAFNEMLRKARSSLGADGSNPQVLFDQIASLPESTQKFLLGKDYKKVKNLLNILAVERGIIDINQLSGMSGPLVTKLRKIVDLEKTAAKDYKNRIIKPFLKNSIDESEINPAKFVKYFLTEANPKELTTILEKFSPELQEQIKKRVVQEILESGRSGDPDLILKEFATGQTPPHPTLYKALFKFGGGDEKLARQKLDAILGPDVLKLLEDVAGIGAAQRKTSDVAASAGGLVSGSIVANLMNLKFGNAASIIKYRIAAKILSSPAGVAWLTSQKQLPAFGPKTAGFGVASKEIFDLVGEEFANEPELLKTSLALLERNNAEYAERLEEDKAYKQMLIEKGGAVDIFPQFNVPEQTPVEVTPSRIRGPEDFQAATGQPASNFAGVNTASRLANPNVFAPPNMTGASTINPTMAKGQQLFPDSITFASQGGIVSAAKPKQRVI